MAKKKPAVKPLRQGQAGGGPKNAGPSVTKGKLSGKKRAKPELATVAAAASAAGHGQGSAAAPPSSWKPSPDNPEDSKRGLRLAARYYQTPEAPRELALRFLEWMIHPVSAERFFEKFAERRPLYICRSGDSVPEAEKQLDYYKGWFGRRQIFKLLAQHRVRYTSDVDLAQYKDGRRYTLNPAPVPRSELPEAEQDASDIEEDENEDEEPLVHPRATPEDVQSFLDQGASLRWLCPQRFSRPLWRMLSIFDDLFGTPAGVNSYLTPAGTQGFSPHYDDVDVFVLQLEGSKRWRIYRPMDPSQRLAEKSSGNFQQEELIQPPVLDVVLHPGDFLYLPRGAIHQCVASPDADSLHVTLSVNLMNSWAQLLRTAVEARLEEYVTNTLEVRKALPLDYASYMGAQWAIGEDDHLDDLSPEQSKQRQEHREAFGDQLNAFWQEAFAEFRPDADKSAEEMARVFLQQRLPLPPTPEELDDSEAELDDDSEDDGDDSDGADALLSEMKDGGASEDEEADAMMRENERRLEQKLEALRELPFVGLPELRRTLLPATQRMWVHRRTEGLGGGSAKKKAKLGAAPNEYAQFMRQAQQAGKPGKQSKGHPKQQAPGEPDLDRLAQKLAPRLLDSEALRSLLMDERSPDMDRLLEELLTPQVYVRLLNPSALRWDLGPEIGDADEDQAEDEPEDAPATECVRVFHCLGNSRVSGEAPLQCVQFPLGDQQAVRQLLLAHPRCIQVSELRAGTPQKGANGDTRYEPRSQLDFIRELFLDGMVQVRQF